MTRRSLFALLLVACLVSLVLILTASLSPARAGSSPAVGVPRWGSDIQVNPTIVHTPSAQRNCSLAINPVDPNMVLAAYENQQPHDAFNAYSWSNDAGRSWTAGRFKGPWGPDELTPFGGGNLGFDTRGIGYYTSLAVGFNMSGYFVLTTTNGSEWSTPVPIVESNYNQYRGIPAFAIDRNPASPYVNSLYIFWILSTDASPYMHGIEMRYSRDGGATWSDDVPIADPNHDYGTGASPAIASDGSIYVAFQYVEDNFAGNVPSIFLDRSTDGGFTWGPDRQITGRPLDPIGRLDYKGRELTLIGSSLCNLMRINHYPSIAASPTDPNTVYVVWNDGRWEPEASQLCELQGRHGDIAFSRTTDGGLTWSTPSRVNDDPVGNDVDQFQPTLAVRPDGLLGVTWYDRRYDVDGHYYYDLEYSQSADEGLTWSPNQRVSDASSNADSVADYKGIDDVGYRKALVYGPDYVLPCWLDTHLGERQGDLFSDRGVFDTPTHTPDTPSPSRTPTRTLSPTRTSTSTSTSTPTFTRTPASTFTSTPTPCAITFSDVQPTDYFYEPVTYLYCHGIISGYAGNVFRPNDNTTRGQLTKIMVLAEGWTPYTPTAPTFRDVPTNHAFYQYIETAYSHGVISGYTCGQGCLEFRPGDNVTRGQITKIVVSAEGWTPYTPATPTFRDVPATDPFYTYIETAYSHNIISGYTCGTGCLEFRTGNYATRAQVSKIVYNAIISP